MLPIQGTSKVAHLEENVAAVDIQLSDEEFAALDRAGRKERCALGPLRTSASGSGMSALPSRADMFSFEIDVCYVPEADISCLLWLCPPRPWEPQRTVRVEAIGASLPKETC